MIVDNIVLHTRVVAAVVGMLQVGEATVDVGGEGDARGGVFG